MALGVKFFLEKPVFPSKLSEALAETIERSERRQMESTLYLKQQIEQYINSCGEEPLPESFVFPFCMYLFDSKFYHAIAKRIENYENHHELVIGHQNKVGYILNFSTENTFNLFLNEGTGCASRKRDRYQLLGRNSRKIFTQLSFRQAELG